MALSDADHRTIKAGIPPQYQPPQDAGGLLSMTFLSSVGVLRTPTPLQGSGLDAVDAVDRLTSINARERYNLGAGFIAVNSGEAAPSFMLTGAQAAISQDHSTKAEERKRDDERFALEMMQAALDAHLAALDAELSAIDKRLEEIRQRRAEIGDALEAMDDLERLAATGKLDPNNPAHRRLLQKAGITPEEARHGNIADLIAQRRRTFGAEDATLDAEWNTRMKRRGEVVRERDAVLAAREDISNADTPEALARAEERATSLLGEQQLAEASYHTGETAMKIIAANAVGISTKGENFNREAAANTDDFYAKSDEIDWDKDNASSPIPAASPSTMKP